MHLAARTGQAYLAQILIKYNANPMARDAKGKSPCDVATAAKQNEMIRLFKPFEYHSVYFDDVQVHPNNQQPAIASAGDIPTPNLQMASECLPNVNAENKLSSRLQSEKQSENVSYGR